MKEMRPSVVGLFTEDQTERLTGISRRQLRYWDRTGFFVPSLAFENRSQPLSRLYSFRDLVSLKIIGSLRNDVKVPLPHLREVKEKLLHLGEDLWAATTLYVLDRRVVMENPETLAREEIVSGQGVLRIPLRVASGDMEEAVRTLRQRDKTSIGKISRTRGVARNQPVVAGTRISVRAIKALHAAGYSSEDIKREYPTLDAKDIRAAVAFEDVA